MSAPDHEAIAIIEAKHTHAGPNKVVTNYKAAFIELGFILTDTANALTAANARAEKAEATLRKANQTIDELNEAAIEGGDVR